jgi:hypothetical protein
MLHSHETADVVVRAAAEAAALGSWIGTLVKSRVLEHSNRDLVTRDQIGSEIVGFTLTRTARTNV